MRGVPCGRHANCCSVHAFSHQACNSKERVVMETCTGISQWCQAGWNVVECSYSARFLFVEKRNVFSDSSAAGVSTWDGHALVKLALQVAPRRSLPFQHSQNKNRTILGFHTWKRPKESGRTIIVLKDKRSTKKGCKCGEALRQPRLKVKNQKVTKQEEKQNPLKKSESKQRHCCIEKVKRTT